MQLTSRTFLLAVVVLSVGAPVLTIALWFRTRGAPVLRAVQRLLMIAVCQLAALALVGTAVNDSFYFYSSWSDLLGTTTVGTLTPASALPPSRLTESRAIRSARRLGHPVRGGGVVLDQTIVGPRSGLSTPALVYLPPQYFEPQYAHTRFPVSLVFPGYPGNPPMYLTRLPLPRLMQTEVAAGRAQPFIAVIIKETVLPPRDTECADVVHGPKVETLLAVDVRSQLSRVLRVRTDPQGWAMMGDSTGGFCAVKMVMRHPNLFGSAVGLSGYYQALLDNTTGALYGGSQRLRDLNSPLWRLRHLPAPPVAVLATISRQERTYPQTVALIHAAKPPMRLSSIISPTGGHNTNTWRAVLPQAIDWLSQQFGAPRPAT